MFASATATAASRACRLRRSVSPCCGVTQPFWTSGLVAVPGDLGEIAIGFGLLQRGLHLRERPLRLRDLMLELGGGDLHQQLPGLDVAADVDVALGDVAARPGVDIGLLEGFGGAGPGHRHACCRWRAPAPSVRSGRSRGAAPPSP